MKSHAKNLRNSLLLVGFSWAALTVHAAEETKTVEYELSTSNDQIQIHNLAGNMHVVASTNGKVMVRGTVIAYDKSAKKAEDLLNKIKFVFDEERGKDILTLSYPVEDYDGFVYNPERKSGWNSNTTTRYMDERVKISSRASSFGNWANVYANLEIALPADQAAMVLTKKGKISAKGLNNDVVLDTSSGSISIMDSAGTVTADSGSGSIKVLDFDGDVKADSGSGSVTLQNVNGDVLADTGSGSIRVNGVTGIVKADTGSGSVQVNDYQGGDLVEVDTGSGSVRVNGDLSNVRNLDIDTGSGSVKLVSTAVPSLDIDIDTGSGGINVDLPELKVQRDKRGSFEGVVGSGAGKAVIDTGSGSVSFRMASDYVAEDKETPAKPDVKKEEVKNYNADLASKLKAKLNADDEIRKANLYISAEGDQAIIKGEVDSLWTVAKIIKLANEVDGVDGVSMDIDTKD